MIRNDFIINMLNLRYLVEPTAPPANHKPVEKKVSTISAGTHYETIDDPKLPSPGYQVSIYCSTLIVFLFATDYAIAKICGCFTPYKIKTNSILLLIFNRCDLRLPGINFGKQCKQKQKGAR